MTIDPSAFPAPPARGADAFGTDGAAGAGSGDGRVARLLSELRDLRELMLRAEAGRRADATTVHAAFGPSARNLLHYLALRSRDLRPFQRALAELGLSSLGRSEGHALRSVEAVLDVLRRIAGDAHEGPPPTHGAAGFDSGPRLLAEHTDALLGRPPAGRRVRILVTMPGEAATDFALVRRLLERGMDCARINCAHDDAAAWKRMADNVRRAQAATGRDCRILMDLAGPKLRTGPVESGPPVLKVRPTRDEFGRVTRPARVWITSGARPVPPPAACAAVVPVGGARLGLLRPGHRLEFEDARGSRRSLEVVERTRGGVWADLHATAYLVPGTELRRGRAVRGRRAAAFATVAELPRSAGAVVLRPGDRLVLTRSLEPGRGAQRDPQGTLLAPARIGCTLPEVFASVRGGESVWFDDGRIGGVVRTASADHAEIEVLHASPDGDKLRADKGINLPDTALRLPSLTAKDLNDLEFVAAHADAVALSFVHDPEDVLALAAKLRALGDPDLGVVLKIETRRGFERLPELLLAAMRGPRAGVMIARGDLAVECGFERMAEVQEEILWICEAAHVPVVWATQVLDTLARTGRPSRAEITDAAMGERAECVMLNKGPHVESAVAALDDILRRMEGHQDKKTPRLRPLRLARPFGA